MNYFIEGLQGAGKSTLVGRLAERFPAYRIFREGDYNPVELAWCAYMNRDQYEAVLRKYEEIAAEIRANTTTESGHPDQKNERAFPEEGKKESMGEEHYIVTYTRILTDIPGFHKDLEKYEIYNARVSRDDFEKIILSRYAAWNGREQIFECSIFQNIIESQILYYEMPDEEIMEFYRRLKDVLGAREYRILYLEVEDIAKGIHVIRKERVDENGNEMWFPLMMAYIEDCPWSKKHDIKGFDGLIRHLGHRKELEMRLLREVFPEHAVILRSKDYNLEEIREE